MTLRSTPRMWTLNSSSRSPSKTVRPMPTMPGRSSSTGKDRALRRQAGRQNSRSSNGKTRQTEAVIEYHEDEMAHGLKIRVNP